VRENCAGDCRKTITCVISAISMLSRDHTTPSQLSRLKKCVDVGRLQRIMNKLVKKLVNSGLTTTFLCDGNVFLFSLKLG
jgi:hypothetical protein